LARKTGIDVEQNASMQGLPDCPVVKTSPSNAEDAALIPD